MKYTFKDSNGVRIIVHAKNEDDALKKLKRKVRNPKQFRIVDIQNQDVENLLEDSIGWRDLPRRE